MPGTINPESLKLVNAKIAAAVKKSGRLKRDVQIVAVTKTFPLSAIESAINSGISCIGENRVQEIKDKLTDFNKPPHSEFHFIGHLQSNKVRKVLQYMDVIETVDSLKLANKIANVSADTAKKTSVFLQINTGNDPAKHGFSPDRALHAAEKISGLGNLSLDGVMTIPPFVQDENILAPLFEKTRQLRDEILKKINPSCKNLSMGMSGDYELAIEHGATHIRLGTILFGRRTK